MEKIFVLGAGTMGAGIVQAFAQKGYEVIVRDIKDEFVERGLAGINKNLSKLVAKGKMDEATKEAVLSRISGTTDRITEKKREQPVRRFSFLRKEEESLVLPGDFRDLYWQEVTDLVLLLISRDELIKTTYKRN